MESPELPSGFELVVRRGAAWIEHLVEGYRVIFSLRRPPGGARTDGDIDVGRTVGTISSREIDARARLCDALGIDPALVMVVRQVHGGKILDLGSGREQLYGAFLAPATPELEADGLFLPADSGPSRPAYPAVVTADCLPVVVAGPEGLSVLHLGWRGLATGMLERSVEITAGRAAVIGPAIGPCCYTVGPEVHQALGEGEGVGDGPIDLPSIASERLRRSGVGDVISAGLCTSCQEELLFSHRRDGESAGRQITIATG